MNLQDRLMGGRAWIQRHGIGCFASIALPVLALVWWNQSRMTHDIEELERLVRQVARSPANAPDAERAVALGREAIRKGQWDLGQIYLVNAITNAPREIRRLKEYATAVLERNDSPIEAIDRLSSMLQLAAYQVDSDEVRTVFSLIDKAEQTRKRLLEGRNGGGQVGIFNPQSDWDRLSHVDPNLWKDPARLSAHLQSIEDFISKLDELTDPPAGLSSKAAAELFRWTEVAQAVKQFSYIDNCLGRLENGDDICHTRLVRRRFDRLRRFRSLRWKHEDLIATHQAKMETAEAKAIYKQRGQTVELRFADAKAHRGLRRFSGRGLKRVRIEVGLSVLAHNLVVVQTAGPRKAAEGTNGTSCQEAA